MITVSNRAVVLQIPITVWLNATAAVLAAVSALEVYSTPALRPALTRSGQRLRAGILQTLEDYPRTGVCGGMGKGFYAD